MFHSIKGGVGRTLALANFAKALARAGKRVLMLDFDYTAPGLHTKFGLSSSPGYIDYLRETSLDQRCQGASGDHWHKMSDKIHTVPAEPNLQLLTAGDETREEYWGFLSSFKFQRLFYFTEREISGLSARVFPIADLVKNKSAFVGDLDLIRSQVKPDYLLVDCKTGLEAGMFAVQLWADRIVHLLPANSEGAQGAALFVASGAASGKLVFPVICRVPERFSQQDVRDFKTGAFSGALSDLGLSEPSTLGSFLCLHEYRGLEDAERLLLDGGNTKDLSVRLSHDYIELFESLADEVKTELRSQENTNWKALLNMAQEAEILEQYFELMLSGLMLNQDRKRNVALRVETLRNMMDSIFDDYLASATNAQEKEAAKKMALNAFRNAGLVAGRSFGKEMMGTNQVFTSGNQIDIPARLAEWSNFDFRAGFGQIQAVLDPDQSKPSGTIMVTNNFLTKDRAPNTPDINEFFSGYLQGVLEKLLVRDKIAVTAIDKETFIFSVSP
ncbi:MAG: hypothetical protein Q8M11_16835 [Sulfuritalea sp.]|nr:hypothetical protein [Sulfuritalea sp.]MDP1981817.1 hypothetical protein [Sulfuritalea sp.]